MSKYINGVKGNQVMPNYKNKNDRMKEVKAKLADAIASGASQELIASYKKYIAYHTKA